MARTKSVPNSTEVFFDRDEIIVSKTDLAGRITYANQTFCRVAGYTEEELLGQPHSIVRHPDMPRAVFKLLWDTLAERREIFAYVKNITKAGGFYWVFAHVTPSFGSDRTVTSYHSNRRVPDPNVVRNVIAPLYNAVLDVERQHKNGQQSLAAGYNCLVDVLKSKNVSYDELIFSL